MTSVIFRSAVSVRARLIIAALAVCSVALAGCQGGDATGSPENTTTTAAATSSVTPTPTPSPTPSGVYKPADASGKAQNVPVPVKPPLADQNSKEGLEAFTKYWFELLSYGYETGDTSASLAATAPGCQYCTNIYSSLGTNYATDRWIVGGTFTIPSSNALIDLSASSQKVTVQVLQSPTAYMSAPGVEASPAKPSGNSAVVLIAGWSDGGWVVQNLHPLK